MRIQNTEYALKGFEPQVLAFISTITEGKKTTTRLDILTHSKDYPSFEAAEAVIKRRAGKAFPHLKVTKRRAIIISDDPLKP